MTAGVWRASWEAMNLGSFERGLGLLLKGFGVDMREVRADPYRNYMAVSIN